MTNWYENAYFLTRTGHLGGLLGQQRGHSFHSNLVLPAICLFFIQVTYRTDKCEAKLYINKSVEYYLSAHAVFWLVRIGY